MIVIFIISVVTVILGLIIYIKKLYKLGYMFFYYKSIEKYYKIKSDKNKDEIAEITGAYIILLGLIIGIIYLLSMVLDLRILGLLILIFVPFFYYKLYKSLNEYKGEKLENNKN